MREPGSMSDANYCDVYFSVQGTESILSEYRTLVAWAKSHGCGTLYL